MISSNKPKAAAIRREATTSSQEQAQAQKSDSPLVVPTTGAAHPLQIVMESMSCNDTATATDASSLVLNELFKARTGTKDAATKPLSQEEQDHRMAVELQRQEAVDANNRRKRTSTKQQRHAISRQTFRNSRMLSIPKNRQKRQQDNSESSSENVSYLDEIQFHDETKADDRQHLMQMATDLNSIASSLSEHPSTLNLKERFDIDARVPSAVNSSIPSLNELPSSLSLKNMLREYPSALSLNNNIKLQDHSASLSLSNNCDKRLQGCPSSLSHDNNTTNSILKLREHASSLSLLSLSNNTSGSIRRQQQQQQQQQPKVFLQEESSYQDYNAELLRRYDVSQALGNGAFSVVRLGMHKKTGYKVALKIMSKQRIQDLGAQEHVTREIRHLWLCGTHPNVTTMFDVINAPEYETTTLALEYAAGGELLHYILNNGGKLSNEAGRKFFQQLINGLEFMHSKGVVHRDLKLENLLLDHTQTNIKIADFGFSNMIQTDAKTGKPLEMVTCCGSPHHAAPEVICGEPYMGPPVDIWSAGVVLYSMLLGTLPFQTQDDSDIPELYRLILTGTYYMPSNGLIWGARQLINGMICVDPKKRVTISQIKAIEWFQVELPKHSRYKVKDTECAKYPTTVNDFVVDNLLQLYGSDKLTRDDVERAVTKKQQSNTNDTEEDEDERAEDLRVTYRLEFDKEIRQKRDHRSSNKFFAFGSKKNKGSKKKRFASLFRLQRFFSQ